MTVSFSGGRWHASLLVERTDPPRRGRFPKGRVGMGLGLKALATPSDGAVVEDPRFLRRSFDLLAKARREPCRCQRGSRRRSIQRAKVAELQARAASQRADALHKLRSLIDRH